MAWFSSTKPPPPPTALKPPNCSFCHKTQPMVKKLIAGPACTICDECVGLCNDILAEDGRASAPPPEPPPESPPPAPPPQPTAEALSAALRGPVMGQAAAVSALLLSLRLHHAPTGAPRAPRVLVVGPSGVGKTTMGMAFCAASPWPSLHADAGRLTESGYVGENVENLGTNLLSLAGEAPERAERGLLFLDGLERLIDTSAGPQAHRSVNTRGVQRELLRLLDGRTLSVPAAPGPRHPQGTWVPFPTAGLLIAAAARIPLPDDLGEAHLRAALCEAGFLPALIARFDRVVAAPALDAAGLRALLHHRDGPLRWLEAAAAALQLRVPVDNDALEAIIDGALASGLGGWALRPPLVAALERALQSGETPQF